MKVGSQIQFHHTHGRPAVSVRLEEFEPQQVQVETFGADRLPQRPASQLSRQLATLNGKSLWDVQQFIDQEISRANRAQWGWRAAAATAAVGGLAFAATGHPLSGLALLAAVPASLICLETGARGPGERKKALETLDASIYMAQKAVLIDEVSQQRGAEPMGGATVSVGFRVERPLIEYDNPEWPLHLANLVAPEANEPSSPSEKQQEPKA